MVSNAVNASRMVSEDEYTEISDVVLPLKLKLHNPSIFTPRINMACRSFIIPLLSA